MGFASPETPAKLIRSPRVSRTTCRGSACPTETSSYARDDAILDHLHGDARNVLVDSAAAGARHEGAVHGLYRLARLVAENYCRHEDVAAGHLSKRVQVRVADQPRARPHR